MIEPKSLRYILVLAEEGSFSRAAKRLNISQPALTRCVQKVEQELKVPLFERSPRALRPTRFGQFFLENAQDVMRTMASIQNEARRLASLDHGSLAIGSGPIPPRVYLARALAHLVKRHPGIEVDVKIDSWQPLRRQLLSGEIELAIYDPSILDQDSIASELKRVDLAPVQLHLFCAKTHPLLAKGDVTLAETLKYPWVTPYISPVYLVILRKALEAEAGGKPANLRSLPDIRTESFGMAVDIVAGSDCVGAAPMSVLDQPLRSGLIEKVPAAVQFVSNASILYFKDRTLTPASEALIEELWRVSRSEAEEAAAHQDANGDEKLSEIVL